ncbi:MAG: AAA family ATPase [Candidatus Schekmanbacteria bacterium]|nr:AAA family ATPase [Candidatus Schekmanbacteria bacterium]
MIKEELRKKILDTVRKKEDPLEGFYCDDETKEAILAVLVAGRHLLLEGPAGVGKTTAARIIAKLLPPMETVDGCRYVCSPEKPACPDCIGKSKLKKVTIPGVQRFVRVQGSSELLPEDLIGDIDPVNAMKYGIHDYRSFTPGKIQKANRKILFIDELNRVPQRTQNTLLQVLEEGVTTIGGFDIEVNVDTLVIATDNPEEYAGVEKISETLSDRFERVLIGYPTRDQEIEIIERYGRKLDGVKILKKQVEAIADICRRARREEELENPPSVRTSLSIYEQSQAVSKLRDKKEVDKEDVVDSARRVLAGKISISGDSSYFEDPEGFVRKVLDSDEK